MEWWGVRATYTSLAHGGGRPGGKFGQRALCAADTAAWHDGRRRQRFFTRQRVGVLGAGVQCVPNDSQTGPLRTSLLRTLVGTSTRVSPGVNPTLSQSATNRSHSPSLSALGTRNAPATPLIGSAYRLVLVGPSRTLESIAHTGSAASVLAAEKPLPWPRRVTPAAGMGRRCAAGSLREVVSPTRVQPAAKERDERVVVGCDATVEGAKH